MSDESIIKRIEALEGKVSKLMDKPTKPEGAVAPHVVVDDADLDSSYGNYVVKKNPPRWDANKDGDYAGKRLSECAPAFLDSLAGFCDWRGRQDDLKGEKTDKGQPKSYFAYRDGARARGWAKRIREGHAAVPPPAETRVPMGDGVDLADDELPF